MCTVTFIPLSSHSYLLTSNRDEKTTRAAATPPFIDHGNNTYSLLYPGDPQGGGSWIATDDRLNAVCLLNGAVKRHQPDYPYRHSRGLVVIDFFRYDRIFDFFDLYDLSNIEPFTFVVIHDFNLYEFRWDGKERALKNYPFEKPRIWSSVTLYDDEVIKKRERWFNIWMKEESRPDTEKVLHFHCFGGEGDKNTDLLMAREAHGLRTVSITSVLMDKKEVTMTYKDLLNGSEYRQSLLSKEKVPK